MKSTKFDESGIFPVFYKEEKDETGGILFHSGITEYLLYKDNSVTLIKQEELLGKEINYPENLDEIIALKNIIEFIYNRLLTSQNDLGIYSKKLFTILKKIMKNIEISNEELVYEKLKVKFENKG